MSVELACTCDGLPAHSHVWHQRLDYGARRVTAELDPYDVRVWVDWRAVARDLLLQRA